ncbi:hypothetical protein ACFLZH_02845 [Patescibacteria group bacterium]
MGSFGQGGIMSMDRDREHEAKARKHAKELGLEWDVVVDHTNICNFIRSIVLHWLCIHQDRLSDWNFWDDMDTLQGESMQNKIHLFIEMGYPLPKEISDHPNLFNDFYVTILHILDLFERPTF